MGTTGIVFDIQRFSLHDGPGIRTTVFLKGCPLACAWCHNPEGLSPRPEVLVAEARCRRCGACVTACPEAVEDGAAAPLHRERCRRCGACVEACPTGARRMAGRELTAAAVVAEIERDRVFHEESGGGATFSGGEPLLQFEFVMELLDGCRAAGVHVALDTCGQAPRERVLAAGTRADLVLYDLKCADDARHRAATGSGNADILANLRALAEAGATLWLRVPVVAGFNDDDVNAAATARLASELGVRRVSLLPYHELGTHKRGEGAARRHGSAVAPAPPAAARLAELAARYRERGLDVGLGG